MAQIEVLDMDEAKDDDIHNAYLCTGAYAVKDDRGRVCFLIHDYRSGSLGDVRDLRELREMLSGV